MGRHRYSNKKGVAESVASNGCLWVLRFQGNYRTYPLGQMGSTIESSTVGSLDHQIFIKACVRYNIPIFLRTNNSFVPASCPAANHRSATWQVIVETSGAWCLLYQQTAYNELKVEGIQVIVTAPPSCLTGFSVKIFRLV